MKAQQCQHYSVQWVEQWSLASNMEVSFPFIAFPQILHMKMCLEIHACVCIFWGYILCACVHVHVAVTSESFTLGCHLGMRRLP